MSGSSESHAAAFLARDGNPTHAPPAREGGSEGGPSERMRFQCGSPLRMDSVIETS